MIERIMNFISYLKDIMYPVFTDRENVFFI